MFVSCFDLVQCCRCIEESMCNRCVVFCRVNHVGNHTCIDEDVQRNLFNGFGRTVVLTVFDRLDTISQQRFCAAGCQSYTGLFFQSQFIFSAPCGECYFCFFGHTVADTCPQEGYGCFRNYCCRDEDMYRGSVYTIHASECMVFVVVDTQGRVTSACGSDGRECEVGFAHVTSNIFAYIDRFAAAQTEDHVCIFYHIQRCQSFTFFKRCFAAKQNILYFYCTFCCCFIDIFFCCVDGNFITDYNCLCTKGRADFFDFIVSIFTSGITRVKNCSCHNYIPPK